MKISNNENYLSEKDYINLANACDHILNINLSLQSVIAMNFLHILRYSPTMSLLYKDVLSNKYDFIYFFISCLKNIFYFIKKIFLSIIFREKIKKEFYNNLDFLFVSHYTGCANNNEYYDSYFGEIIKRIDIEKFRVLVLYINHTNQKPKNLYTSERVKTIILSNDLNFKFLIKIYLKSLIAFFKFKELNSNLLLKKLSTKARIELFSPGAIQAQIIAHHISSFVAQLAPKCLVTTYEGHSWERLSYRYVKQVSSDIKCLAYQHAPIFKYQHAIRRGIGGGYDPDIIFSSGVVSEELLSSCEGLKNSKIMLLGSGRCLSNLVVRDKKTIANKTCLVVPEGTFAECLILFKFSLECAKRLKDVNFIWRMPPQIDFASLQNQHAIFKNLEKNISIDAATLEEHIDRSEYVLYRGSSVVIHAVLCGLIPLYFMRNGELSMDPLFSCEEDGRVVRSVDDFCLKIKNTKLISREIQEYCSKLYTNLSIGALEGVLV